MLKSKQPFVIINSLYLIRCSRHTLRIRTLYLAEFSINRIQNVSIYKSSNHLLVLFENRNAWIPDSYEEKVCTIAMDTIKHITQSSDAKNRSNLILERLLAQVGKE